MSLQRRTSLRSWFARNAAYHIYTAVLFTWTDYKTIFFPVLAFGSGTAPVQSSANFWNACIWVWWHLLLCNVSNQANSKNEDALNRPWRPLPSGRVSCSQAVALRKVMVAICIALSAVYGFGTIAFSSMIVFTTVLYDECGLARHPIGKNFCNICGYTAFQAGATLLLGGTRVLDQLSIAAVGLSGMIIFTTVQLQDFPDQAGDAAIGRVTFPIYAPEFSRVFTLVAMGSWSILLGRYWGIGVVSRCCLFAIGMLVGIRCFAYRTSAADTITYRMYNVWLMAAFLLPLHARRGILYI
ncbi:unnamed protein product [Peniophora sp. CBMAI 1063]|nr:unnamed protein product [Peniophora sp. CBMAI 1063]